MGTFKDSLKKWFYTQGTQVASASARIPLLDANGNPIGSDTMDNLVSVLDGIVKNINTTGYSLNDAPTGLIGSTTGTVSSSLVNAPINATTNFLCYTFNISNYRLQIYAAFAFSSSILRIFIRQRDNQANWTSWKEVSLTSV